MRTARPSEVATTTTLAQRYGVTERTIRRLCAEGRLPHHRIASAIRFTTEDQAAIEAATSIRPEESAR